MIVAFTGQRGHGKNTAADALIAKGFVPMAFADPIRDIAKIAYGLQDHEMADPILKEATLARWPFKSPRDILQRVGTEMFRKYVDDTWVHALKFRIQKALDSGAPGVVITDLRFLNEAAMLRNAGATILKIIDPRKPHNDAASQHQSEMEIDKITPDWTITNDQTIARLHVAVLDILF